MASRLKRARRCQPRRTLCRPGNRRARGPRSVVPAQPRALGCALAVRADLLHRSARQPEPPHRVRRILRAQRPAGTSQPPAQGPRLARNRSYPSPTKPTEAARSPVRATLRAGLGAFRSVLGSAYGCTLPPDRAGLALQHPLGCCSCRPCLGARRRGGSAGRGRHARGAARCPPSGTRPLSGVCVAHLTPLVLSI